MQHPTTNDCEGSLDNVDICLPSYEELDAETDIKVQTDMTVALLSAMKEELLKRTEEVYQLRKQVAQFTWTPESFRNNDKKLNFYSGISTLKLFMVILEQLDDALSSVKVTKLTNF